MVIAADVLDVDLPEAVVEALRQDDAEAPEPEPGSFFEQLFNEVSSIRADLEKMNRASSKARRR
jgi:hypothetical protein